jgi:hypothetical protein
MVVKQGDINKYKSMKSVFYVEVVTYLKQKLVLVSIRVSFDIALRGLRGTYNI